ncbi:MAG TPA: BON domain-containing protein [Burkholderiales bacterium]|nr:BON domain-containing protein [Burkholderiales bacterium]
MERALIVVAAVIAAACAPDAPVSAPKAVVVAERSAPAAPKAAKPELPPEAKPDPNKELAKRVQRALEEENRIHAAAIDVTAHGGIVTLWGTAATPDERQRASRVAYRVIGVTAVENKLAIASGS